MKYAEIYDDTGSSFHQESFGPYQNFRLATPLIFARISLLLVFLSCLKDLQQFTQRRSGGQVVNAICSCFIGRGFDPVMLRWE